MLDGTRDLAIDYRPIGDLIPYARNARTHSEAQVALIAGSIREYGFTNPVPVDGANGIIAGHGRVLAAGKLGPATLPVIELAHLTETQKRAYVLADNKLADQAGCPHSGHMDRENAAVRTNVCFGGRGHAAWGEVDRQVWAGLCENSGESPTQWNDTPVSWHDGAILLR